MPENKKDAVMKSRVKRTLFVVLLIGAFLPGVSAAEIYKWVDKAGIPHFTDDFSKVPPKFQEPVQRSLPVQPALKKEESSSQTTDSLLEIYSKAWKAQQEGDVAGYRNLIAAEVLEMTDTALAQRDRKLDSEELISQTYGWVDPQDYELIGLDFKGNKARVNLWKDSEETDATGKPRADFFLILFKKENDGWKLSWRGNINDLKFNEDGDLNQPGNEDIPENLKL